MFSDAQQHGAAVLGVQTKATVKQGRADGFVEKLVLERLHKGDGKTEL